MAPGTRNGILERYINTSKTIYSLHLVISKFTSAGLLKYISFLIQEASFSISREKAKE